jgi:hypothetical protein
MSEALIEPLAEAHRVVAYGENLMITDTRPTSRTIHHPCALPAVS